MHNIIMFYWLYWFLYKYVYNISHKVSLKVSLALKIKLFDLSQPCNKVKQQNIKAASLQDFLPTTLFRNSMRKSHKLNSNLLYNNKINLSVKKKLKEETLVE